MNNRAILQFTQEFIEDVKLFQFILISNDIKFDSWSEDPYTKIFNVKVTSDKHFKEGYGYYSLQFTKDILGWHFLTEIKLEELITQ